MHLDEDREGTSETCYRRDIVVGDDLRMKGDSNGRGLEQRELLKERHEIDSGTRGRRWFEIRGRRRRGFEGKEGRRLQQRRRRERTTEKMGHEHKRGRSGGERFRANKLLDLGTETYRRSNHG
ncbi:hypothetical protein RJT34_02266 [Clitoria ternatea]|uniref:Uncharacterized protein n=1 Tax=Clitoria ternatea TaxID=43366 RepID=A0AAN9KL41_CLITE